MNPLRRIDWDWFCPTLFALGFALLVYVWATDPGLRPTQPVPSVEEAK